MKHRTSWRPSRTQVLSSIKVSLWIIGIVVIAIVIILGYRASEATLWDLLELLIVPAALVVGGFLLNKAQRERELEIAKQRAQDAALQGYLDQMTQLLIEGSSDQLLSNKRREVIHARTLHVLEQLDESRRKKTSRKRALLRFLHKTDLLTCGRPTRDFPNPFSILWEANLKGANLEDLNLEGACLKGAYLTGSTLRHAGLKYADLSSTDLTRADLTKADLTHAKMRDALLRGANLTGADLRDAKGLSQEQVNQAYGSHQWAGDMPDTELPDVLKEPAAWSKPLEEQKKRQR